MAVGNPSLASVQLVSGSSVFNCTSPTVTVAGAPYQGTRGYTETLTCMMPAYLPAAVYAVGCPIERTTVIVKKLLLRA